MILFPAIDLKDGQVVRLLYGDMDAVTVYGDNPGAQAAAFADTGFDWLHVVDLNGAIEGRPVNREAVEAICLHPGIAAVQEMTSFILADTARSFCTPRDA